MKNIIYTITRDNSGRQYNHVYVDVYSKTGLDRYDAKPVLSLSWQGDIESDHWYAFKAKSKTEYVGESAVKQFRLATSILASLSDVNTDDIGAVLKALDCPRMVEDRRVHEWLPIDEVKPDSWHRYMSWSEGSCQCATIAPDEETAVKLLIKEYAKHIDSNWGHYADKLAAWIKDGSPVKVDEWAKAPDTTDLETLIKPMKDKPVETPEQVAA